MVKGLRPRVINKNDIENFISGISASEYNSLCSMVDEAMGDLKLIERAEALYPDRGVGYIVIMNNVKYAVVAQNDNAVFTALKEGYCVKERTFFENIKSVINLAIFNLTYNWRKQK